MSLSKENRLKTGFKKEKVKGRIVFSSPFFSLKTQKTQNIKSQEPRFAIIISSKTIKTAVKRNFLKRRIKEIIKLNLRKFKKNTQNIFYIKKGIENLSFKELKNEIESILKKLK